MANINTRKLPKGIKPIPYPSENMELRFTSKDYTASIILNNETGKFDFSPLIETPNEFTVTQVAHGFNPNWHQSIYHDGSIFKLAKADNEDTVGVWVVTEVIDDNTFKAASSGRFIDPTGHGFSVGITYLTDQVIAGQLTNIVDPNGILNPLLYAETPFIYHVLPYRPSVTI